MSVLGDKQIRLPLLGGQTGCPYVIGGQIDCPYLGTNRVPLLGDKQDVSIG